MTVGSILVDVDAVATAQPALECAAHLARRTGARLRIVDVVGARTMGSASLEPELEDELARHRRKRLARMAFDVCDVTATADVLVGPPAEALIRDVERFRHDMVVRSHVRDLVARETSLGTTVDAQLVRHCPCPVWAVGPGAPAGCTRVVAAVDAGAEESSKIRLNARIVELAHLLAGAHGRLILLYAWQPAFERQIQAIATDTEFTEHLGAGRERAWRCLSRLADTFGLLLAGARLEIRRGHVSDVLPDFAVAEGIDTVVVGTMERTGFVRRLRRSTVERMMQRLPCSFVAVKASRGDYDRNQMGEARR